MKNLSKRSDPLRRWKSFKKHTWLLLQPLFLASIASIAWYCARRKGFAFSKQDEGALTSAVVSTLGVAYGITASLVFGTVWDRYQKVVVCVLKKDQETFLLYRDERIPIVVHMLLIALSVPLLLMVGGLNYEYFWAGFSAVFSVAFVLALYLIVVVELQDPSKSLWFAERIPDEWLKADIDEFFKLAEEAKNGGK